MKAASKTRPRHGDLRTVEVPRRDLSTVRSGKRSPSTAVRVAIPLIVMLPALLAFVPALSAGFVNFDDGKLLQQNQGYQGLSSRHIEWMFTTTYMGHYQPLTWLSYAFDFQCAGTDPGAYHRTNLVLHALNAVLVYFVALRLIGIALARCNGGRNREGKKDEPTARGGTVHIGSNTVGYAETTRTRVRRSADVVDDKPGAASPLTLNVAAAIAALLFAVHPLRVESVAWVSERRDVLSVFFLLLATIAYLKSVTPGSARLRAPTLYAASLGLLALSLLAKAWGMTFFVIATLLNVYPLARLPWRVRTWFDKKYGPVWLQTIPFALLGLVAAIVAGNAQGSAFRTMKTLGEWSGTDRIIQVFYGLAFYVHKTVWPTDLAVLYPLPPDWSVLEPRNVVSIVAVVAGTGLLWIARRRVPALLFAGLAYGVWLAPVLGLAQSGPQLVADRYSYVACIGWVIAAGGGLAVLWRNRPTIKCYCVTGVPVLAVFVALFVSTTRQTRVWHDSASLWAHAVSVGADSTIAHRNHGIDLGRSGDLDGSIRQYRAALALDPQDGSAWYLLANGLRASGRFEEAEDAFRRAIEHLVQKHLAWQDLGIMYYEDMDRIDDAIRAFRKGIDYIQNLRTMRPAPAPRLYLYLGMALRAKGDFANARPALEAATKFKRTKQRAMDELRLIGGGE